MVDGSVGSGSSLFVVLFFFIRHSNLTFLLLDLPLIHVFVSGLSSWMSHRCSFLHEKSGTITD